MYQVGTYNITIYHDDGFGHLVHQFDCKTYRQKNEGEQFLVVQELRNGLSHNQHYYVNIIIQSNGVFYSLGQSFGNEFPVIQALYLT